MNWRGVASVVSGLLFSGVFTAAVAANPAADIALQAGTVQELETQFAARNYHWPPRGPRSVPPLSLTRLPSDFPSITSSTQRRELFLRAALPLVLLENRRLHEQRQLADWLLSRPLPDADSPQRRWLDNVQRELRVRGELSELDVRQQILHRLDEIPTALALAQTAIETGWGTSRFALQGNSLFGQWTYQAGDGLAPRERNPGTTHLVASFPNLRASVRSYMRNLNSGSAYKEFRAQRAELRQQRKALSPTLLATHLHRYSQRGEDYVRELNIIINGPGLNKLGNPGLADITNTPGEQHSARPLPHSS
ncbi:MAG: hypothetical protein GXP17_03070 [Gammaproteobacteria bacterium]|nr:hypothetical protein [Gammaproteobacteria bacterium]